MYFFLVLENKLSLMAASCVLTYCLFAIDIRRGPKVSMSHVSYVEADEHLMLTLVEIILMVTLYFNNLTTNSHGFLKKKMTEAQ